LQTFQTLARSYSRFPFLATQGEWLICGHGKP
jgi:hypothetical protein